MLLTASEVNYIILRKKTHASHKINILETDRIDDWPTRKCKTDRQIRHVLISQAAQTHVAREGCNVIYITYVTRWCRVTAQVAQAHYESREQHYPT